MLIEAELEQQHPERFRDVCEPHDKELETLEARMMELRQVVG